MSDVENKDIKTEGEAVGEPVAETATSEVPVEETATKAETIGAETTAEEKQMLIDMLPDDLKRNPSLQSFKDVEALAKSYVNAQGLLGKKVEDMAPEELQKLYGKALGAPEKPDEYEFEGMEYANPEAIDWYKNTVYELNMTQEQAKGFAQKYIELEQQAIERNQQARVEYQEKSLEELKKDWGNQVDAKIDIAKKAVKEYGGDKLVDYLNQTGLGDDPSMVKTFAKIGEQLLESDMAGDTAVHSFKMTPEQAKQAISQKKMSSEFMAAYTNPTHPAHAEAVEDLQGLYALAYNLESKTDPVNNR